MISGTIITTKKEKVGEIMDSLNSIGFTTRYDIKQGEYIISYKMGGLTEAVAMVEKVRKIEDGFQLIPFKYENLDLLLEVEWCANEDDFASARVLNTSGTPYLMDWNVKAVNYKS